MSAWPPVSVRQRLAELKVTRSALQQLDEDSPDAVHQAMARYLAVRSAGLIEAVRDDLADRYCDQKASPEVARRVRHNLRGGQGVTPQQLCNFLGTFHPGWVDELNAFLNDEEKDLQSQLGALVSARKKIAHGDGEAVTASKALKWADSALSISEWLIKRFDPNSQVAIPIR